MKSKKKAKLIILVLGIIFALSSVSNNNLSDDQSNNDGSVEIRDETNLKSPKKSGTYIESFIHIDGNWTDAIGKGWFYGDGSWGNPYVIENVTIDATSSPTRSGIFINNSKNEYFIINNCTVYNAFYNGINLANTNNGTLTRNNCSNNKRGIRLYNNCNNNTISGNTANDNDDMGIILCVNCNNNTITGNTANENNIFGINFLTNCNNNTISGNTVNDNDLGIDLGEDCNKNTISGNTAINNTMRGIDLMNNCNNNTISRNTVKIQPQIIGTVAIRFESNCNNNTISGNTVSGAYRGIQLINCNNNTISGNRIRDNVIVGLVCGASANGNFVFLNEFDNNSLHAQDDGSYNKWDNGAVGNYWENHTTPDLNNDGIVDTPYTWIKSSTGSKDNFPLKENPFHLGEKIHIDDSGASALNWSQTAKVKVWCTGSGTYSDPYVIDGLEIDGGGSGTGILIGNSSVYFTIQNCKIYNAGNAWDDAGIKLEDTNNGTLTNNNCSNDNWVGICIINCDNTTISGNTVNDNINYGIFMKIDCNNNYVLGNTVNYNGIRGIRMANNCYNNSISENTANDNIQEGIYLRNNCYNNTISGNTVNDNGITGIILDLLCQDNTISGNTANNNIHGIVLNTDCDNNTISGNTANNNTQYGIAIFTNCDNNTIRGNAMRDNSLVGLFCFSSATGNLAFLNDFTNNGIHAQDGGSYNRWDNGSIGNYWDNYTGADRNDDGIGDDPYDIPGPAGKRDNLPIWWDAPVLNVTVPVMDQKFGSIAPTCNISIVEGLGDYFWCEFLGTGKIMNLTKLNGVANENITGSINQTLWSSLPYGKITIRFYCNDTRGYIDYLDIDVIKIAPPPPPPSVGDDDDDDEEEIEFLGPTLIIVGITSAIGVAGVAIYLFRKRRLRLKRQE